MSGPDYRGARKAEARTPTAPIPTCRWCHRVTLSPADGAIGPGVGRAVGTIDTLTTKRQRRGSVLPRSGGERNPPGLIDDGASPACRDLSARSTA
jgi:hypothetical protein